MEIYEALKSTWKKLGIKGQVKNYSSFEIWVLETDTTGTPIARILSPGFKTPKDIDIDAFKSVDGIFIDKHKEWWKFYDLSTVEICSKNQLIFISVITKTAVKENHFGKVSYKNEKWGEPLKVITNIRKNKKRTEYLVSEQGWLDFETALKMVCHHEIDNARPVFPKNRQPYIRSKRDKNTLNNFSKKEVS